MQPFFLRSGLWSMFQVAENGSFGNLKLGQLGFSFAMSAFFSWSEVQFLFYYFNNLAHLSLSSVTWLFLLPLFFHVVTLKALQTILPSPPSLSLCVLNRWCMGGGGGLELYADSRCLLWLLMTKCGEKSMFVGKTGKQWTECCYKMLLIQVKTLYISFDALFSWRIHTHILIHTCISQHV